MPHIRHPNYLLIILLKFKKVIAKLLPPLLAFQKMSEIYPELEPAERNSQINMPLSPLNPFCFPRIWIANIGYQIGSLPEAFSWILPG